MKTNTTPATMNANNNEYLDRLRAELQEYHDNASKGGANRQRNMAMLAEDIARLEASANQTTEFSELTHAGQCLDIYLHNTAEIYENCTRPAIARVVRAIKAGENVSSNYRWLCMDVQEIAPAIRSAVGLVQIYDHMTPTAEDIEQVTRNYAAYIVDCAKYESEK